MGNTPGNKHASLEKKYLVINYYIKSCSKSKTRKKFGIHYTSITKYLKNLWLERFKWLVATKPIDIFQPVLHLYDKHQLSLYTATINAFAVTMKWSKIDKYKYINSISQNIRLLCKVQVLVKVHTTIGESVENLISMLIRNILNKLLLIFTTKVVLR